MFYNVNVKDDPTYHAPQLLIAFKDNFSGHFVNVPATQSSNNVLCRLVARVLVEFNLFDYRVCELDVLFRIMNLVCNPHIRFS